MKKPYLSHLFCLCVLFAFGTAVAEETKEPRLALPSAKQIRFADWEVGAFFHYNINPFSDYEHSDGQPPASLFAPTELDTDQWIRTAKAMGARYAVLTARHEGGFCLWPTKTTEYSIANSPWKDGKGDLVKEFIDSCRKHGIGVGLYHTAGFDAHEALKDWKENLVGELAPPLTWGDTWGKAVQRAMAAGGPAKKESFKATQVAQLRELLTNYGPIDFMWSDHWDATDPDGVWRAVTDLAEELQPDMVFMGPDSWVPGNETGHVVYPMWNAVHTKDGTKYSRPAPQEGDSQQANDYGLLETDVVQGHPFGKFWRVRECTTHSAFHYGGWFWHPDEVKQTYPKRTWEHLDLYYRSVGLGANTIINLPADTRGLLPDDIVKAAEAMGRELRKRFSTPIAEVTTVQKGKIAEVKWDSPTEINTVVTMENIATGQKIARYTLEAMVDGKWQELTPRNRLTATAPYSSSPGYLTIGHKKIDRVAPVTTNHVRLRVLESIAKSTEIRSLAIFHCDPIIRTFDAEYPQISGVDTTFDETHNGVLRDRDYRGGPIEIGGVTYKTGIMLHPGKITRQGIAEFDLTLYPKATGMKAVLGIEDMTGSSGSCHFIVQAWVDGEWRQLYRSGLLKGADAGMPMKVSFPNGATKLRLISTDGGNNTSSDHAIWADAVFLEE